ncbi:asparagine synthase-related protein, partial [Singulisphaera rosea]
FPELTIAAEGPIMDTSCAALMRLAEVVHEQGYKVALTGEGADEALAGYVWFKSQKIRESIARLPMGVPLLRGTRRFLLAAIGGGSAHRPPELAIGGVRTAQQDMYELIGQARSSLYTDGMWNRLAGHDPYADLNITNDRIKDWHPLNQSLYVGYKVMLAGLLMISKGDRIAMHSSVETRYPFLDDDVIQFCSQISPDYKLHGRTEKWILRQVAAKTLPTQIANRPKTMFRASLSKTFLGPDRPHWVDQLLSPESLQASGYFDAKAVARERAFQNILPRITARRFVMDVGLTCVVTSQLWHHLFCGGGLCDLPTWTPPVIDSERVSEMASSNSR